MVITVDYYGWISDDIATIENHHMNPFLCVNFHFFLSSVFHLLLFLWQSFSREDDYAMMYDAGRKRDKERETLQTAGAKTKKRAIDFICNKLLFSFSLLRKYFIFNPVGFTTFGSVRSPQKIYI